MFPKALDLDRPKRARTTFSPDQLYELEREFQKNQYLVGKERTDLSKRLKLSETQVCTNTIASVTTTGGSDRDDNHDDDDDTHGDDE